MTDKIESGASESAEATAEISKTAPATENNSGAQQADPEQVVPDDIEAIVDLVIEKLGPAIADTIKAAVHGEAVAAFDAILRDPATAAKAREAAAEVAREADAKAEIERAELRAAAEEQARKDEAQRVKDQRAAEDKAEADYGKAKERLLPSIDGVGFFEHGEDEAVLRFADGSTFLPGHDRKVALSDFDVAHGKATFNRVHDFDRNAPGASATEAWLVVSRPGKKSAALRVDLGSGLRVGAGAGARIPANNLAF